MRVKSTLIKSTFKIVVFPLNVHFLRNNERVFLFYLEKSICEFLKSLLEVFHAVQKQQFPYWANTGHRFKREVEDMWQADISALRRPHLCFWAGLSIPAWAIKSFTFFCKSSMRPPISSSTRSRRAEHGTRAPSSVPQRLMETPCDAHERREPKARAPQGSAR